MASFVIEGGHKLHGEIHPQGAKNEVLQILCATLLTSEEVTVTNIPDILYVNNLILLLRDMGVKVSKTGIDSYTFKADTVDLNYLESDEFLKKCSSLRGSVMLVGPLVARFGKALISKPGGDKIGRRRLDTHFIGIQKLGACFNYDEERSVFSICAEHLEGTYMLLDEASVTGTANIVMASVLAKGKTTIYNAACEPYLQQLCRLLNRMGAKLSGIMPKFSCDTFLMVSSLPVIAAIPIKLPTSIISGNTRCVQPCRLSTPSIVSKLDAIPEIFAPMRFNIRQSCCR